MPAFLDADVLLAKLGGANSPISQLQHSIRIKGRRGVDIVQDFPVQTPGETLLAGEPRRRRRMEPRYEQHANETLATFRALGLSGMGGRRLSAGVSQRNLDRSLETLLIRCG